MPSDTLMLHSSVKPSLMRKTLLRGSFIAALGFLPLIYGALALDSEGLAYWGMPLFFGGLALISFGMLPFRRLTYLEQHPNKLEIIHERGFIYFKQSKKTFTVPHSLVEEMTYYDNGPAYGIALFLKQNHENKVVVHSRAFDFDRYQRHCRKHYGCDLFLPYFTQRSFHELKENCCFLSQ